MKKREREREGKKYDKLDQNSVTQAYNIVDIERFSRID